MRPRVREVQLLPVEFKPSAVATDGAPQGSDARRPIEFVDSYREGLRELRCVLNPAEAQKARRLLAEQRRISDLDRQSLVELDERLGRIVHRLREEATVAVMRDRSILPVMNRVFESKVGRVDVLRIRL